MHLGIGLGLLDIASSGFFNFEAAGGHLWQSFPSSAPSAPHLNSLNANQPAPMTILAEVRLSSSPSDAKNIQQQPASTETQLSVAPGAKDAGQSTAPTFELLDINIWVAILAATKWFCGPDTLSSCNKYLSQFNQKLYSAFLKPGAEIPEGVHPRQLMSNYPERFELTGSFGKSMDEFAAMAQKDQKTVLRTFYNSLHFTDADAEKRINAVVHKLMPNYASINPLALKKFMENNKLLTLESIVTLPVESIQALASEDVKISLNKHPSLIPQLHKFSQGFFECLASWDMGLHSFLFKGKFNIEQFFNITEKGHEILELDTARAFLEEHPEYLDSFITAADKIDAEQYVAEVIAQHNRTKAIA